MLHWLTIIFGLIAVYCVAGFLYTLSQGPLPAVAPGLWFWGAAALIFACASPINQRLRRAKSRESES